MKHISRKFWLAFSFVVLASTAFFAYKFLPAQKSKSRQIVVDRLVNQLVCKAPSTHRDTGRFPRGLLSITLPEITARSDRSGRWSRPKKDRAEDYCMRSSHKISFGGRQGKRRGDNWRPIGGDF